MELGDSVKEKKHGIRPNKCDSDKRYLPKRFIVAFLGFFGYFNAYSVRGNLSVALVAMTNDGSHLRSNSSQVVPECPREYQEIQHSINYTGVQYDWDSTTQGYIMSAFFYGYFVTVLLGGYMAERFGPARISGLGMLLTSFLTLLTPTAVDWGFVPFLIIRVLEGMGVGSIFPSMTALISRWSPKLERSRMSTITSSGYLIGILVTLALSGWLCSTEFLGGWPAVFYTSGTMSLLWVLLWSFFVYETPYLHPNITKEELSLFEEDSYIQRKKATVPWKAIATSLPFWAMLVGTMGGFFIESFLFLELPTFFKTVLHFDIKTVGFLSALPYILKFFSGLIVSHAADILRKSGWMSITVIRKMFNSIAGYGIAVCFICIAASGCRSTLIMALLCIGMTLEAMKLSGFNVIAIDMSPDFAGTIYGLSSAISSLTGGIAPAMTGILTASGPTTANWSNVFYVTAAVAATTSTFFAFFASAELQPWGKAVCRDNPDPVKIAEPQKERRDK